MKKRILFVSEASYVYSGFGKFYQELIKRIHTTGKYEVAEFASYGIVGHPNDDVIKWRYYANAVDKSDERYNEYKSYPMNEFGFWRFERVLLDFKPDIVFDMRDTYMFSYQATSPLRDYFHWCIVPTIDSVPQKPQWINIFESADSLFTYSDWAIPELKKVSDKINIIGELSPGVNNKIFSPVPNKKHHRDIHGIDKNINIIGTVMRNQVRKLYPELFAAFSKFLKNSPVRREDTFLYCHTSYPDNGWEIPELLLEHDIANRVLFTYTCPNCKNWEVSFFKGERSYCNGCYQKSMFLPNTGNGVSDTVLSKIYNFFDIYVQYSNCEGFGLPQTEAASCGIPIASVDYSAMSDIVRKVKGKPISIKHLKKELNDYAYRAIPDNDNLIDHLSRFFNTPYDLRQKRGFETKLSCDKHYNWDDKAKILEKHLDSIELTGKQGKWDSPPNIYLPQSINYPEYLNNSEFITWCYETIYNRPMNQIDAGDFREYVDILSNGYTETKGGKQKQMNRKDIIDTFVKRKSQQNDLEKHRCGILPLIQEDYIDYADIKEKANAEV